MMELNWKMMFHIDKSIEERNSLHNLLSNISTLLGQEPPSLLRDRLQQIVTELPPEYE
jgi:hypothetical protein